MKSIITNVAYTLIAFVALAILLFAMNASLDKGEVVSCLKLQEQSREYREFFATQKQADMCDRHGINLK